MRVEPSQEHNEAQMRAGCVGCLLGSLGTLAGGAVLVGAYFYGDNLVAILGGVLLAASVLIALGGAAVNNVYFVKSLVDRVKQSSTR